MFNWSDVTSENIINVVEKYILNNNYNSERLVKFNDINK